MKLLKILKCERGVIPVVIIWAIIIGIVVGAASGIGTYMSSRGIAAFLVGIASTIIFFILILPNLSTITNYFKKVTSQLKKERPTIDEKNQ